MKIIYFLSNFSTFKKLGLISCLNILKYNILKLIISFQYRHSKKESFSKIKLTYLKLNKKKTNKLPLSEKEKLDCISEANFLMDGYFKFFNNKKRFICKNPNWFITDNEQKIKYFKSISWTKIKVFKEDDIKIIWEPSRFSWVTTLVMAWIITDDNEYLILLENYLNSWIKNNIIDTGPNWVCGQECSIRIIYLIQGLRLLERFSNNFIFSESIFYFIYKHLIRIKKTHFYSVSQKNNHWVSESAALYIGGLWLTKYKKKYFKNIFIEYGKRSLQKSMNLLVMNDGTFAQYSTNYHRLVIDTLVQVELNRKYFNQKYFSKRFYKKVNLLISWLFYFFDNLSFNTPNLGGNDGSYCYQLHFLDYKNYQPTLQISSILFRQIYAFSIEDSCNTALKWEGLFFKKNKLNKPNEILEKNFLTSRVFNSGGFIILRPNKRSWGYLRIPNYKFRPSQNDPLHFDLWSGGKNILRDGGTYSYNSNLEDLSYFSGIKSHNSIQFDFKEQMPLISRFLRSDWLSNSEIITIEKNDNFIKTESSYKSKIGNQKRRIKASQSGDLWIIEDRISGFKNKAILRWRLIPVIWKLKEKKLTCDFLEIEIKSKLNRDKISLINGFESLYYLEKNPIKILQIELSPSIKKVETHIKFLR